MRRGYLLLNHNYRTRMGELDLVLYKDGQLVFAEVKTRAGRVRGGPGPGGGGRAPRRRILGGRFLHPPGPAMPQSWNIEVL